MEIALSIGLYPGVLLGIRTYNEEYEDGRRLTTHALYLPFIDFCVHLLK